MNVGRILVVSLFAAVAGAQQQSGAPMQYPVSRTVDTVTNYFGTRVPDPYRWMEAIETPEVASWIKAENAITMPYLASLPGRDLLQTRITAVYNYACTSIPYWDGGRWYYTKNSGLQRRSVWSTR